MKTSIIYLGIALVSFTNVTRALDLEQALMDETRNTEQTIQITADHELNLTTAINKEENSVNTDLNLPIFPVQHKTIEETMAEDSQIIESLLTTEQSANENHNADLSFDFTSNQEISIEQIILEDSKIIENPFVITIPSALQGTTKETQTIQ